MTFCLGASRLLYLAGREGSGRVPQLAPKQAAMGLPTAPPPVLAPRCPVGPRHIKAAVFPSAPAFYSTRQCTPPNLHGVDRSPGSRRVVGGYFRCSFPALRFGTRYALLRPRKPPRVSHPLNWERGGCASNFRLRGTNVSRPFSFLHSFPCTARACQYWLAPAGGDWALPELENSCTLIRTPPVEIGLGECERESGRMLNGDLSSQRPVAARRACPLGRADHYLGTRGRRREAPFRDQAQFSVAASERY